MWATLAALAALSKSEHDRSLACQMPWRKKETQISYLGQKSENLRGFLLHHRSSRRREMSGDKKAEFPFLRRLDKKSI